VELVIEVNATGGAKLRMGVLKMPEWTWPSGEQAPCQGQEREILVQ
jgi:hypothetical protein